MKNHPKTAFTQHLIVQISKSLLFFFLLSSFFACTSQQSPPVTGTIVPWEDMESLIFRSETQADLRKKHLDVQIQLNQRQFHVGENISVKVFLSNKYGQDMVVRKPTSMPVIGNDATTIHGLVFLVTEIDTGIVLERGGSMFSGFVDEGFPPPEYFSVLPAERSSITHFELSEIFGPLLAGNYTLQLIYTNNDFGAETRIGGKSQFIDYNAWIGTISSNVEHFQVSP